MNPDFFHQLHNGDEGIGFGCHPRKDTIQFSFFWKVRIY